MNVVISVYLLLLSINSLSPLAIVLSSESIDPFYSALLRMSLASLVGIILLTCLKQRLPFDSNARRVYYFSLIGVFFGGSSTYLAAQHIASGLIALLFGLSPIMIGVVSSLMYGESGFIKIKWFFSFLALAGLFIIFYEELCAHEGTIVGGLFALLAVFFTCLSGLLIKKDEYKISPLSLSIGTMLLSIPLFSLATLWLGEYTPLTQINLITASAIGYLAIVGSLLGFYCYFFILNKMSVNSLMIMTLLTPAIAMLVGFFFHDEQVTRLDIIGALTIFVSIAGYFWGEKILVNDMESKLQSHKKS